MNNTNNVTILRTTTRNTMSFIQNYRIFLLFLFVLLSSHDTIQTTTKINTMTTMSTITFINNSIRLPSIIKKKQQQQLYLTKQKRWGEIGGRILLLRSHNRVEMKMKVEEEKRKDRTKLFGWGWRKSNDISFSNDDDTNDKNKMDEGTKRNNGENLETKEDIINYVSADNNKGNIPVQQGKEEVTENNPDGDLDNEDNILTKDENADNISNDNNNNEENTKDVDIKNSSSGDDNNNDEEKNIALNKTKEETEATLNHAVTTGNNIDSTEKVSSLPPKQSSLSSLTPPSSTNSGSLSLPPSLRSTPNNSSIKSSSSYLSSFLWTIRWTLSKIGSGLSILLTPLITPQPGRNNNNDSNGNDNGGSDKGGKGTGVSIAAFTILMAFRAISDAQNMNLMASSYTGTGYKGISSSIMDDPISKNVYFPPLKRRSQNRGGGGAIASAVQRVGPAVVRIDTESPVDNELDDDNDGSNEYNEQPQSQKMVQQGQGSGLIIDGSEGLILTNEHLIRDASRVLVTLTDGRKYMAEVKGTDEIVDLAVLSLLTSTSSDTASATTSSTPEGTITTTNLNPRFTPPLPEAPLGNSDNLSVGRLVVAVGSPGGLDNTVTMGIVSGLGRSASAIGLPPGRRVDFIQTDAAINLGNSGGPLVDVDGGVGSSVDIGDSSSGGSGVVVGISTCIRANMEGTGFAIPINRAREVMSILSRGERVNHGYIGVSMVPLSPELAKRNNADPEAYEYARLPERLDGGVVIANVYPDSPAERAGLCKMDVVIALGGRKVRGTREMQASIDGARIGQVSIIEFII